MMSRRLHDRLRVLERTAPSAADAEAGAWVDAWMEHLKLNHERGPGESWADVTARLWGFESSRALRNWLRSPTYHRQR